MAYNFFPAGYQAYQPIPQQQNNYIPQQNNQQAQAQQSNLLWVQGEAGAKSYLVAPNTTVTLWDTESQTIYIKSADASGMPSIKTLDYTVRDGVPDSRQISPEKAYATKDDVDYLKSEINALKEKYEGKKEEVKKK